MGLNSVPGYFAFSTILLKFEVMSVTSLCVCVSKQTVVNKLNVKTKTINLCFQVRNNGEKVPGADPRLLLGGAAPLRNGVTD